MRFDASVDVTDEPPELTANLYAQLGLEDFSEAGETTPRIPCGDVVKRHAASHSSPVEAQ